MLKIERSVDFTSFPDRQQINKGKFCLKSIQGDCMASHQLSKNFVKMCVHCHKNKIDELQGAFVLL